MNKTENKAFDILKERGYVYQATNEGKIKELLNSTEPQTFYLGIDPTADSLHIGHFFALTMVRRLQKMGYDLENRLERSELSGWGRASWSQESYHL